MFSTVDVLAVAIAGGISIAIAYRSWQSNKRRGPLPPGPRGLPLLGNMADLPDSQPWVALAKLGEIYGGIVYLSIVGTDIVVLNNAEYAHNMLVKKSRIYSDRPVLTMAGTLVGLDRDPTLVRYGPMWIKYRRHFNHFMGTPAKVAVFSELFHEEVSKFVHNLRSNVGNWVEHTSSFAGGILLKATYGMDPEKEKELMQLVASGSEHFSELTAPNAFMVDVFPSLQYVPSWFPGASWKKKVPIYRKELDAVADTPFEQVKARMANSTASPCFVSSKLESELSSEDAYALKWAATGIYSAGADTTVAAIECLFLAMLRHPEMQHKAQTEIDIALGVGVTPTFTDRASLPYCEALYKEVFRVYMSNAGALGLPHATTEDDIHEGYFIPKGTMVLVNTWHICRDPNTYPNPEAFTPERFMETTGHIAEQDPQDYVFGYGRRGCPGRQFANATVWLAWIQTIAALELTCLVPPSARFLDGTVSHPEPFEIVFKPRIGHFGVL